MPHDAVDLVGIERDVTSCVASHTTLIEHLRSLDPVDSATPSRLPGWSVGHVLTHIARNADGHLSMLDGLPQYPHGVDGRNADIETGATRTWTALIDDVASTNAAVEARWAELVTAEHWSGSSQLLFGTRPTALLPALRQREVEVHHADLGLGYEFTDMPSDYIRRDLRLMGMLWKARKPMGLTPLPAAALELGPADRLAWMMGRVDIDGLAPADLF